MGYGGYYWGLYRDYYRDPFPHSLPSTRQLSKDRLPSGQEQSHASAMNLARLRRNLDYIGA